jgi:hypothetical protein
LERFEGLHGTGQFLDETMILLNHVVEISNLGDLDQPEPSLQQQQPVDVWQACEVRTALIDDDLSGQPSVQRRVVNRNTTLGHNLLKIAIRHGVSDVENAAYKITSFGSGAILSDRFHQNEKSRAGRLFGLGLSIIDEIIRDHDGRIEFDKNIPCGLIVRMIFPIAA